VERTWIITDACSSFSASDFTIAGRELGLDSTAFCRKTTLHGGRQTGVELIELSNGIVSLRVCPTRGMGIIDGSFGSRFLGWHSPVRDIVHPQYINLYDLGGRGCHYGFNEFLNRGGIEWSGAMGDDEVVNNMGNSSRVFLPLHGKVGWTPASRVALNARDDSLILEGDIPEQNVFGVNYLLRTRLTVPRDSSRIEIEDTLCNHGAVPGEYEMLYHTNFGPPFLEEGAHYFGTYDRLIPRDEFAVAGLDTMTRFDGPTPGFTEQVFLFRAAGDHSGRAHQVIANATESLAAHVSFAVDTLPYTILWKRTAAVEDGYVAGLNPCSDLPNRREVERRGGRVGRIGAHGEIVFHHTVELVEGHNAVKRLIDSVRAVEVPAAVGSAGDFEHLGNTQAHGASENVD
jgi:Domain of unknown function (DUF4432)